MKPLRSNTLILVLLLGVFIYVAYNIINMPTPKIEVDPILRMEARYGLTPLPPLQPQDTLGLYLIDTVEVMIGGLYCDSVGNLIRWDGAGYIRDKYQHDDIVRQEGGRVYN